jgi:hypothetical protein
VVGGIRQHRQQCFGFARDLHFPNDLARIIPEWLKHSHGRASPNLHRSPTCI